jgi:Ca2+-binding RTX toxin-like protein
MQISLRRPGLAVAACATALAVVPAAQARPVTAQLRVESGKALVPGYAYATDTAGFRTDRRAGCDGSGATKTVSGPSALGLLGSAASATHSLRPVAVSDKYDVGLLLCGVGNVFAAANGSSYWLYKVDHRSPTVGGDQFALHAGDQVLWYFVDPARGIDSGAAPDFSAAELALVAPARVRAGRRFGVRAFQYDGTGRRSPAAGVVLRGAGGTSTDATGRAQLRAGSRSLTIRAVRGADIPAVPLRVCVSRVLSRCPAVRGERILGTNGPDRLRGTRGADTIYGRGGADVIDVRGGGHDRVRCGSGRDLVRLGRGDRAARDCERVRR